MTTQFGRCNVCSTPCASCMHLGRELLQRGGKSNCSSDKSCEHDAYFEQVSETSAASSHESEGGTLDSSNDRSSFVEGAGPCFSAENQSIYTDKIDETFHCSSVDQTGSSSSVITVRAEKVQHKQDVADSQKTVKLIFAQDGATGFVNCSSYNGGITSIDQSNAEKPSQPSEFVRCDGESASLYDVKVCDICGDAGQEEFLAVCSKCNVGAEHVYCMCPMLETVPYSNWMCEECMLSEDKDKMTKTKFETLVTCPKYESLNPSNQGCQMSNTYDFKELHDTNTKRLDADKSSGDEASSLLSAKRTSGNVICTSMTKRLALGPESRPSCISGDSSKARAPGFEVKPSHKLSLSNDYSSQTKSIQGKSGRNLPKTKLFQTATGSLSKSRSFNDSGKRPKVQRLDVIPENRKFSIKTHYKKKGSTIRTMRKTLPLNDASCGSSKAVGPKIKRIPAKFSDNGSLKRLRCMNEHISVKMTSNTRFKRLQVGSTKDGTFVSASSHDKKFESHGKCTPPDVCGTKYLNINPLQISDDSVIAGKGKTLCLPIVDMVEDVRFASVSDASQEPKQKGETSHRLLESTNPCSWSDAIGEKKLTVLRTSSSVTEKAPQTSPFTSANKCLSNGSGSEDYGRTGSLDNASYCHLLDCSSLSILDATRVKDMDGSSQIDAGPSYCNQIDAYRALAVPLIDYIWKGECEIQNSSRLPRILYRIQAHLSTMSSSKIPEAVKNFSNKILLEEVSRLTAWPIQFQEYYPQDDSIGLYIFAEDIESYINYKSLVQYMVDRDIALKGNFDRIELLIFSSHLLPESSHYWNGLLYLWGVFKERKVNCST
ncbi:ASI1-immunoprecipitated protein 2 isoform X2 [Coffea arabica]|uniref:ASI1-immunoprecipitated protein 2 isoform X2 n=1 Tax=Coffea arabica TaxID=13443 RepID=A0ABM4VK69_COFAR